MKTFLLLLASCVIATAAPPTLPVVNRPKPAHSPKHSVKSKDKAMFVPASEGNPVLVMKAFFERVTNSPYGSFLFTGQCRKPGDTALVFEVASEVRTGAWMFLASFGSEPTEQEVFVTIYSSTPTKFIRVTPMSEMTATVKAKAKAKRDGEIVLAPEFLQNGARAWKRK